MTDHSQAKKKTNKWLWPLLAALVLVAILAWAFNRGADDGDLSERMASDPLSRQDTNGAERGEPAPPAAPVSTMVPDNENGNASVITEADAARGTPVPGGDPLADGVPGRGPGAAPAPTQPGANPAPGTAPAPGQ